MSRRAERLRLLLEGGHVGARDFRSSLLAAPPRERDAFVDAAFGLGAPPEDGPQLPRDGVPYFLEANPLPGLNPDDSDLVIMAGQVGWSYDRLVSTIVNEALKRCKK